MRITNNRLHFLAKASELLESSLQYEETLQNIARLLIPTLGDYCIVDLFDGKDSVFKLMVAHRDPAKDALLQKLKQYPPNPLKGHPLGTVLSEKRSVLVRNVSAAFLERISNNREHAALLKELEPVSYMCVPLLFRDRLIGAIVLARTQASGLHYKNSDLLIAEELAKRCANAIANAELYETVRRQARIREETMAIVSHDLKNPISAIQLGAMLSKTILSHLSIEGDESKRLLKLLNHIESSATQSLRLIQDLLDFARIQTNGFVLAKKSIPVSSIFEELAQIFRPLTDHKKISLTLEGSQSSFQVVCDKDRIQQALSNLIGNAVKFTPNDGNITVGFQETQGEALFWVKDNGPGLSQEHLEHLFQPYWQAKENKGKGVGLGLSIAKGIVEAHGGRIWVESEASKGCAFFFSVPHVNAASKAA